MFKNCDTYQNIKITTNSKYGKLTLNYLKVMPWTTADVYLFLPWTVQFRIKGKIIKEQILDLNNADAATSWTEMINTTNKNSESISTLFDKNWF